MQQPLDKSYTDLRAGLVTEAGPLNSPPGSTQDEQNFHILVDGSRRRRRGLKQETDQNYFPVPEAFAAEDATSVGRWFNAGGDPEKDFIVLQLGSRLYFYQDSGTVLTPKKRTDFISLDPFVTTGDTGDAEIYPVSFGSGNGVLLVTGRYVHPFYVEYDSTSDSFSTTRIDIIERDFVTLNEPGGTWRTLPTTLTDAHLYNLRNRGWRQADIEQYFSDEAVYPALNMIWYFGYARGVDGVTYINEDGVKSWNSTKMAGEVFGNASAPMGALFKNPFDTTVGVSERPATLDITSWSYSDLGSTWTITINTSAAHSLTHPAEVTITGQQSLYTQDDEEPGPGPYIPNVPWTFDGEYTTASVVDADTFTITVDEPTGFDSFDNKDLSLGTVLTGAQLDNPEGYTTNERPTAAAWYAGRAWFSGARHPELSDRIWFSQTVWSGNEYGDMYQVNDPTAEELNRLISTDGGTIIISDMGRVQTMLSYNGSLLVFADNGVWEIRGSQGVFTADNYTVRKLSDLECTSPFSPHVCEGVVLYSGTKGVHIIQPDERTGILYAQNMTAGSIQSEWNAIPSAKQKKVRIRYDDANKQAWVLYSTDASDTYQTDTNRALVFDMRLNGWSKMTFPSSASSRIVEAWPVQDADQSEVFAKLKFWVLTNTGTRLQVCDLNHDDYTDFDGTEQDAYLVTAYDNLTDWARFRQAPVIHTFMAKTETGFDASFNPVNESSLTMQARWDWTDNSSAGKWASAVEVYRHRRPYVPTSSSDTFDTGYPVVVARNKVRGRGRSLHLKFTAGAGKDAHLLGYAVRYKITGRV